MEQIVTLIMVGGVTLFIFGVCGWVIKQHWIDKRWINESSRFVGRNILAEMQNADARENIEHVIYQEEDEREEDFGGEGLKPGEAEEIEMEYDGGGDR
ncbi:MAG: hypothetical protein AB1483_13350 [Candidatus Zixiibacteriota bacterium]